MFKNSTIDSLLIDLINIKSVSGEEDKIFKAIKSFFIKLNFIIEIEEQNNIVFNANLNKNKTILLAGHLDTVLAQDEDQYKAKIINENNDTYIYGRGACDMKAGLSVMLKLALDIYNKEVDLNYNIKFLFYSDEERALPNGLNFLIDKNLKKESLAIILEPTDNKVAIACLGTLTFKVNIKGEAAHSSIPWTGSNAIYNCIQFIQKIKNINYVEKNYDGIKAVSSLSVTQANTTNSHNVIPDNITLTLNYRFLPDFSKEEAIKYIEYKVSKDYELIDISPACICNINLPKSFNKYKKFIYQGWCDMAQLNEYGIPTIAFGPGNESLAHKVNESISLSSLNSFYKNLLEILKD